MSELFEGKSPQEQEDLELAICRMDPSELTRNGFSRFLRRLDEVRAMDEDAVPDDFSDAWEYRDTRYVDAVRRHHEEFYNAAEAFAKAIAAERAVYEIRDAIRQELSPMLIARNKIADAPEITTADFDSPDATGTTQG